MEKVSHRYKVGQKVSRGFNGDWYPCGVVTRITKKFLFTDTGHKFSLRTTIEKTLEDTPEGFKWVKRGYEYFREVNSPFILCSGHRSELNPHF